jgi:hypothetical protein
MINGEAIRRNAMKKAREFYKMTSLQMLRNLLNMDIISQTAFEQMSKSHLRGALKSMRIKFKSGNLDHMALKSLKFRELQCLLSTQTLRSFDEKMTLEFLNDCFMIDVTYEFESCQSVTITDPSAVFAKQVDLLVFGVLCDLANDYEEIYLLELENKSKHNALKLLLSNEEHSMNDCHNGNLPFETAMQTS